MHEDRVAFVTTYGWEQISDVSVAAYIGYEIVENLVEILMGKTIYHEDTRGCLSDLCASKRDISFKIRTADICTACRMSLQERLQPDEIAAVDQMLETIRNVAMGRSKSVAKSGRRELPEVLAPTDAPDVFLSHFHEDADIATALASHLEANGFRTWYYERDILPGIPHLEQTAHAIAQAAAFTIVISRGACTSGRQIETELIAAHELDKTVFPLLRNLSYEEFRMERPLWCLALRAAVAVQVSHDTVSTVASRMAVVLRRLKNRRR